jgi:RNA polymerase sigma-70 factor (ECF subfamily)
MQTEARDRIGVALRAIYADTLLQPLSRPLAKLVYESGPSKRSLSMAVADTLRDQMLATVPSLRAFAISLTGNRDRADDLVQDTLMRAWANIDKFERGSNLQAWLFTILRNLFHSDFRKRKREVEDPDGSYAARLKTHPDQQAHLDYEDFRTALTKLHPDQREALLLVGAQGMSYEEAAEVCNVPLGTVKSRVNRARSRLAIMLDLNDEAEIGPRRVTRWNSPVAQGLSKHADPLSSPPHSLAQWV